VPNDCENRDFLHLMHDGTGKQWPSGAMTRRLDHFARLDCTGEERQTAHQVYDFGQQVIYRLLEASRIKSKATARLV